MARGNRGRPKRVGFELDDSNFTKLVKARRRFVEMLLETVEVLMDPEKVPTTARERKAMITEIKDQLALVRQFGDLAEVEKDGREDTSKLETFDEDTAKLLNKAQSKLKLVPGAK